MNRPHGSPPLPGPLLPPREEREKILRALPPRAALAVLACPGLLSCCPFGAQRLRGSMRETITVTALANIERCHARFMGILLYNFARKYFTISPLVRPAGAPIPV